MEMKARAFILDLLFLMFCTGSFIFFTMRFMSSSDLSDLLGPFMFAFLTGYHFLDIVSKYRPHRHDRAIFQLLLIRDLIREGFSLEQFLDGKVPPEYFDKLADDLNDLGEKIASIKEIRGRRPEIL